MKELKIRFPNGDIKSYDEGTTAQKILREIGGSLVKKTVAAKFNES